MVAFSLPHPTEPWEPYLPALVPPLLAKASTGMIPLPAEGLWTHPLPVGVLSCHAEVAITSPGERCLGRDRAHSMESG